MKEYKIKGIELSIDEIPELIDDLKRIVREDKAQQWESEGKEFQISSGGPIEKSTRGDLKRALWAFDNWNDSAPTGTGWLVRRLANVDKT